MVAKFVKSIARTLNRTHTKWLPLMNVPCILLVNWFLCEVYAQHTKLTTKNVAMNFRIANKRCLKF